MNLEQLIKPPVPKESDLCKEFIRVFDNNVRCGVYGNNPPFIFHVANEGKYANKKYAYRLKAMGVKAGVADYCVMLPRGRVGFIEFKRSKKERKLKEKQLEFLELCARLSIPHAVTWDVNEALGIIRKWHSEN